MILNSENIEQIEKLIPIYLEEVQKAEYDEVYKWEALIHFQKTFNLEAENFPEMLKDSLSKAKNLLTSSYYFAYKVICNIALKYPEETRVAFRNLYNESIELPNRISEFKAFGKVKFEILEPGKNLHDYQDDGTISVYLFFMFPEKYCPYKARKLGYFAKRVGIKLPTTSPLVRYYDLINELREILTNNKEYIAFFEKNVPAEISKLAHFNLLAQDFIWITSFIDTTAENHEEILIAKIRKIDNQTAVEAHFERIDFLIQSLNIEYDDSRFVFATPKTSNYLAVTLNQRYIWQTTIDYISLILPKSMVPALEQDDNVNEIGSYDALKGEANPPVWVHFKTISAISQEIWDT